MRGKRWGRKKSRVCRSQKSGVRSWLLARTNPNTKAASLGNRREPPQLVLLFISQILLSENEKGTLHIKHENRFVLALHRYAPPWCAPTAQISIHLKPFLVQVGLELPAGQVASLIKTAKVASRKKNSECRINPRRTRCRKQDRCPIEDRLVICDQNEEKTHKQPETRSLKPLVACGQFVIQQLGCNRVVNRNFVFEFHNIPSRP